MGGMAVEVLNTLRVGGSDWKRMGCLRLVSILNTSLEGGRSATEYESM